jgi:hypothetical protein
VELSGALDPDIFDTQFRSLTELDRGVVLRAPEAARAMIEFSDAVVPMDAETLDDDEEDAVWMFLEAQPGARP